MSEKPGKPEKPEKPYTGQRPVTNLRSQGAGFTLVELMVTLAVLAILLGIAVPSFQSVIQNNRLNTAINDVLGAMNFAKVEAIRRNATVRFCINLGSGAWVVENSSDDEVGAGIRAGAVHPSVEVEVSEGLDTAAVDGHACVRFRPNGTASPIGKLALSLGQEMRIVTVEVGVLHAD
jgi:type IV fimbrial biogenesis protein FimT